MRNRTAAMALAAGMAVYLAVNPMTAAEPGKRVSPTFSFSTLRATPPEIARSKSEAWLKAVGRFDEAAFNDIWGDESRSVLDRTADSLTLGHPQVAALLAEVRKPDAPAPTEIPAVLKDPSADPFFRTNIALAFAKAAASKKVYEEALDALNAAPAPELAVDPAAFYFYKAVCEHALMRKGPASNSILRLLDDVADAPDRYKMVATLMFFEMQNWSPDPKDLLNIERLMDNSGRRLELARAGEKTQDIQKKIVFRLDELIKELENQNKPGQGQANGGNCPNGGSGPSGPQPGSTVNPSNPASDSQIMGGSGPGKIDEKQLRQIAEQWGSLPPDKRAKIVEDITRDVPAKYKPMIDEYFKALNRVHGFK